MAGVVIGGGTSAKRLLLLATTAAAMPAVRASALNARHLHSSVRRLSVVGTAQTLRQQQLSTSRVRIAFSLGSMSNNRSARTLQRTLSTLPPSSSNNSNSSSSHANPQQEEQKRRDDEARTIKKKLAADIEKARALVRMHRCADHTVGMADTRSHALAGVAPSCERPERHHVRSHPLDALPRIPHRRRAVRACHRLYVVLVLLCML